MGCIVLSDLLICRLHRIILAGSYHWIVSYRLDWIGWIGLDRIVLAGSAGSYRWIVLAGLDGLDRLDWIGFYWLDEDTPDFMHWIVTSRMVPMRRMDWMGRWWDGGETDRS